MAVCLVNGPEDIIVVINHDFCSICLYKKVDVLQVFKLSSDAKTCAFEIQQFIDSCKVDVKQVTANLNYGNTSKNIKPNPDLFPDPPRVYPRKVRIKCECHK